MKKILGLVLFVSVSASVGINVWAEAAPLAYSAECTFQAVLTKKGKVLDSTKAFPKVYLSSQITLEQFQDAVEPQWGFRPSAFLNVYVGARNEIYLLDDADYYRKTKRYPDDSLAHELTHYYQAVYMGEDMNFDPDKQELEAVEVQSWYREAFMQTGISPCAGAID